MLINLLIIGLLSFLFTYILILLLIPRLIIANIVGKDFNKLSKPKVPEMGGIAIIGGLTLGVLSAVFINSFFGMFFNVNVVFAALISIFILGFIGIVDDLLRVPQIVKAFLPLLSGVPLIVVRAAGSTVMTIPLIGPVDFGLFYLFILIPIGMAVASNLTNMLAGFNGLEAGMGIIALLAGTFVSLHVGAVDSAVLYFSLLGALIAFFIFNWYPARIFPGDVGTLIIGATLAAGSIIGNFESIAALLLLPHVLDFFIKAKYGFPSAKEWVKIKKEGGVEKLYAVKGKVFSLPHLVLELSGGLSEKNLVLLFIIAEELISIALLLVVL